MCACVCVSERDGLSHLDFVHRLVAEQARQRRERLVDHAIIIGIQGKSYRAHRPDPDNDDWSSSTAAALSLPSRLQQHLIRQPPLALSVAAINSAIPRNLALVIDLALLDKPAIAFKTAAEFRRP